MNHSQRLDGWECDVTGGVTASLKLGPVGASQTSLLVWRPMCMKAVSSGGRLLSRFSGCFLYRGLYQVGKFSRQVT